MQKPSQQWSELEDRVYCKIDPNTLQAIILKVEQDDGCTKQHLLRKQYDRAFNTLGDRYAIHPKDVDNEEEEEVTADTVETDEDLATRVALGLLRIKCGLQTKNVSQRQLIDSVDGKGMASKMARNRWQVAVGMVMGMAKMASINIEEDHEPFCVGDLKFDLNFFKASKNVIVLTADSKFVLNELPEKRTSEQIEDVIQNLYCMGFKSFIEYPKAIQRKIIKIARYEEVSAQRVIVRQGYPAENIFFLINGSVVIGKRTHNTKEGKESEKTFILQKGAIFGELEMVNRIHRNATAVSNSTVELLIIECSEFHNALIHRRSTMDIPDHVKFLKKCKFIELWPIDLLNNNREHCVPYYFRRNTLMVEDVEKTDWIFIIRSGLCRVIRKLWKPKWRAIKRHELTGQTAASKTGEVQDDLFRKRFPLYYSLESKTSRIFSGKADSRRIFLQHKEISAKKQSHTKNARPGRPSMETHTGLSPGNRKGQTVERPKSEYSGKRNSVIRRYIEERDLEENNTQYKLDQALSEVGVTQEDDKETDREDMGTGEEGEPVYIQIDTLKPHDVFGLDSVVFDKYYDQQCHPGLGLVSSGDEKGVDVVLLSRSFFVEHASEQIAWRVRKMAKSYPDAEVLEREIQRRRLWAIYKKDHIAEILQGKLKPPKMKPWK